METLNNGGISRAHTRVGGCGFLEVCYFVAVAAQCLCLLGYFSALFIEKPLKEIVFRLECVDCRRALIENSHGFFVAKLDESKNKRNERSEDKSNLIPGNSADDE